MIIIAGKIMIVRNPHPVKFMRTAPGQWRNLKRRLNAINGKAIALAESGDGLLDSFQRGLPAQHLQRLKEGWRIFSSADGNANPTACA